MQIDPGLCGSAENCATEEYLETPPVKFRSSLWPQPYISNENKNHECRPLRRQVRLPPYLYLIARGCGPPSPERRARPADLDVRSHLSTHAAARNLGVR